MKDMKKNTVQLIIAGAVVVLVALTGTFAWFASGDRSWVKGIGAKFESPTTEESIDSGISEIQIYDPVSDNWEKYDGEIPLNFVPNQSYIFKVLFTADPSQHTWLRFTGFEEPEEDETALIKGLSYNVGFSLDDLDNARPTLDDPENANKLNIKYKENDEPYVELIGEEPVENFSKVDGAYVLYYELKLPYTAGNEYFDQSFNADVELIFQ